MPTHLAAAAFFIMLLALSAETSRAAYREVWFADLGIPVGHEQGGGRPAVVVSADECNHEPAGLAI